MRLADDGTLRLSPTDLANHLSCAHLTQLEAAVLRDGLARPHRENAHADLIRSVDEPSALGEFSYEAWDTKLARHAKPNAVLQLTFYSHELERIQGRLPERMHVVLGTGEVETLRPGDFAAFYRRASARLEDAVSWAVATSDRGLAKARPQTYPYPVDHCSLCDFLELCERQWKDDDHLSQVAWIRHDQIERLDTVGISTLEALGETSAGTPIEHMAPQTFETLRHQASLQLFARRTQTHRYDLLPPLEKRGLGLLPAPSHGDLFYDIEGDPFWEPGRSLEYLHGLVDRHGAFTALWAHDRDEERRLFERLIDLFHERLAADPGLHVYHYASYETAVLKRLAAQHATREEELDELLRRDVFCDLFTVVRQSLKISYDSYSIKRVREFFMRAEAELAVLVRRAVAFRNGCKTSAVAVELSADVLRGALAMLERRDPQVATDAQEAVPWLAWRESEDEPLVLGQHTLQGFLWYVLPNKWDAPADELVDVAHALGDLLDAAGAPHRYVALCRSPETERVLRSGGDGWIELTESSGLEPTDTPLLEWSELMTLEESEERAAASLYLEAAVERGQFEPGAPGWQDRQREVMEEFLSTPDESGGTPLERIRSARIEGWLGPPGRTDELGGDRRSRLTALVPLLEQEPDAEAAALALDPLLWLLDLCAEGAPLTQTNALVRSIVQEAVERYPSWWHPLLGKPPQQETQVYPLGLVHELALDLGLVRRRRRELRLSRRGRELRADPPALLRLVAAELADVAGFGADVGLAVALAEGDGASDIPELPILVATQLDVLTPFAGLTGPLWERRRLTEGGRTLALAILRASATGARHSNW